MMPQAVPRTTSLTYSWSRSDGACELEESRAYLFFDKQRHHTELCRLVSYECQKRPATLSGSVEGWNAYRDGESSQNYVC